MIRILSITMLLAVALHAQESLTPPPTNVVAGVTNTVAPGALETTNALGTNTPLLRLDGTNIAAGTNLISGTNVLAGLTNEGVPEVPDDYLVPSTSTNVPALPRSDVQSFRIIVDRNIFNPNRSPARPFVRRERDTRRQPRTESFGLVGTMAYEKGRFAFFDGTSSDYRKVVEPSQSIAGYTVVQVAPNAVTLQGTNGQQVQMLVGTQMRRSEDEAWQLSQERGSYESTASASTTTSGSTNTASSSSDSRSGSSSSSSSASSAGEDEVLKRLLQKREQELNK